MMLNLKVERSEHRFREIVNQTSQFLSQIGFSPSNTSFIPCSGLQGINVVSRARNASLEWYTGPTLLESIGCSASHVFLISESVKPATKSVDLPLRMSITDVVKGSKATSITVSGRLDTGILQEGDEVVIQPGRHLGTVRSSFVLLTYADLQRWLRIAEKASRLQGTYAQSS
jgi:elongation factor 1 alpha-like protein